MAFDGGAHIASIPHVALNILPDIDMQGAAAVVVLPDIDIRSDAAVVVATATTKSELRPATALLLLRLFALGIIIVVPPDGNAHRHGIAADAGGGRVAAVIVAPALALYLVRQFQRKSTTASSPA